MEKRNELLHLTNWNPLLTANRANQMFGCKLTINNQATNLIKSVRTNYLVIKVKIMLLVGHADISKGVIGKTHIRNKVKLKTPKKLNDSF